MSKLLSRACLTLALMASASLATAQFFPSSDEYRRPGEAFRRAIQEGLGQIEQGRFKEARENFQQAQKMARAERDRPNQRLARQALDRLRRVYEPTYVRVEDGRKLYQSKRYLESRQKFEEALQLLQRRANNSPPEFRELDDRLSQRVESWRANADRDRQERIRQLMDEGSNKIHFQDYAGALASLQSARQLMLEEAGEPASSGVDQLLAQARYQLLLMEGDQTVRGGDYAKALEHYKAAQENLDTPELRQRIAEVRARLHYKLLDQAEQALRAGELEQAAGHLGHAAGHFQSDRYHELARQGYDVARRQGAQLRANGEHKEAWRRFQIARQFRDDAAIQEEIQSVESDLAYVDTYAKAEDLIGKGRLPAARRTLMQALQYKETREARQTLEAVDRYQELIRAGRGLLKSQPQEARDRFLEAQRIFNTPEAARRLRQAEKRMGNSSSEPRFF